MMVKVNACKDHVGKGWHRLLDDLHSDLTALDPGYDVAQVKEKFGALVVYLHAYTPGTNALCNNYERLSLQICENCGAPGKQRAGGWIKTLCGTCTRVERVH